MQILLKVRKRRKQTAKIVYVTDNLLGLILPYLTLSLPITIFIMTGFFKGLPNELFEAACIDGCSIYKSFVLIAIPLVRTGFMVTGLMTFVANWNELLLAMVFISDDSIVDGLTQGAVKG